MIKTENLSMVFTTEEVQTKALNEVNRVSLWPLWGLLAVASRPY